MDAPCSIQGNIHAFSLIINVSRILGTYQALETIIILGTVLIIKMFVPKQKGIKQQLLA